MKIFKCPKCGTEIKALASNVAHRCPSNKNKWTQYEEHHEPAN
jgi:predicted Zn-ribbon and HTH transcriptional regulator